MRFFPTISAILAAPAAGRGLVLLSLFAAASFSVSASTLAADLHAEIQPQPVIVGEPAQLVLTSTSAEPEPEPLPQVAGLQWLPEATSRSSQTTIINLQVSQSTTIAYPFIATREGSFTIPAFIVNLGRTKTLTSPLKFKAVQRQIKVSNPRGEPRAVKLEDLFFMRAQYLNQRAELFVGEEIPLEVDAYSLSSLMVEFSYPTLIMAQDSAEVILRDCSSINQYSNIFTNYQQRQEEIGENSFRVHRCRAWLRPVSPGQLSGDLALDTVISIPEQRARPSSPPDADDDPFFGSFFRGPFTRNQRYPYPTKVALPTATILPLPPAPGSADFLGLVGDWQTTVDLVPATARVGEPLTLSIKVSGSGTTETLVAPSLNLPGCRLFPPEITRAQREFGDHDEAEIRYAIIPLQAGPLPLHLRLATFAPTSGQYQETEWQRVLTVAPGDPATAGVATNGGDSGPEPTTRPARERAEGLLYLKRHPGTGVILPLWHNSLSALMLLVLLGPLVWGLAELLAWRRRRFASDPALRRQFAAAARRGRVLRQLRRAAPEAVVAVIHDEVTPYLKDRLALPPGMSTSELVAQVDDPELAACLRDAEAGAYLPGATSPAELRERLLRTLTRLGAIILCAGLTLLATTTASANPSDNPFAAYDEGHFTEAAEAFAARLDLAQPDPVLLYNLGNCRYQQGNLTEALVCFEQARRLAPRDSDIRENLNHVRRRLMLPEIGLGGNPLAMAADLRDHFRPDEWLLLIAAAWAAAGLLLAGRRLADHAWRLALAALALIMLAALSAILTQRGQTYSPESAVVLERGAPIRVLPSATAREAEYRLYPGEPVTIVETRDDGWRRIRGEGGEGWVRVDAVAPLWGREHLE